MNENDNIIPNPETNGESPNLEEQLNKEPENSEAQFSEMQDALQSEAQSSEVDNETDDNQEVVETESKEIKEEKPQKKKKGLLVTLIVLFVLVAGAGIGLTLFSLQDPKLSVEKRTDDTEKQEEEKVAESEFAIKGNDLDDFDLFFLKTENDKQNIVYSPLSIKYALTMLKEGTGGESKAQIEKVLNQYYFKTYTNSEHLSLANALFINSARKEVIKDAYVKSLSEGFSAEVIFDDFYTPDNINLWVSNKTFNLVNNILAKTEPADDYFYLVNALAIDMEWVNELQLTSKTAKEQGKTAYSKSFKHEKFDNTYIEYFDSFPSRVEFEGEKSLSSRIAAIANKYDIIKELGEDNIRTKVQEEYEDWAAKQTISEYCTENDIKENSPDLDEYVNTLSQHYGDISSSTDFEFYDGEEIKAFAKDLKTYDGTTLQYVGIMPKNKDLNDFLKTASAKDLNEVIKNLKKIELDSFKDGVITKLVGEIPHFDFEYELRLQDDLEAIGIENIFDEKEADLSGITDDEEVYITKAVHKANITFSNSGIKAGAATVLGGGKGAAGPCRFNYDFEVPTEEIDLSFNKPYLFLIRDKDSGEIWFAGSVYSPSPAVY